MSNKKVHIEKKIEKLIRYSLKEENRMNTQHKEVVLDLLIQKLPQQEKENQPEILSVIGLSVLWIVVVILVFSKIENSSYILDLIKVALSISLILIPVSSIVLIILKLRTHEKRMA